MYRWAVAFGQKRTRIEQPKSLESTKRLGLDLPAAGTRDNRNGIGCIVRSTYQTWPGHCLELIDFNSIEEGLGADE
jgi:hypothetical protein